MGVQGLIHFPLGSTVNNENKFAMLLFSSSTMGYFGNQNAYATSSSCMRKPFSIGFLLPLVKATLFEAATLALQVICGRKFFCNLCSSSMWLCGGRPRHALKNKKREINMNLKHKHTVTLLWKVQCHH